MIPRRTEDGEAHIYLQRLPIEPKARVPWQLFCRGAAQITLATGHPILSAGHIVHQERAATTRLAGPQPDVIEHRLQSLLKPAVPRRIPVLDGLHPCGVCQIG